MIARMTLITAQVEETFELNFLFMVNFFILDEILTDDEIGINDEDGEEIVVSEDEEGEVVIEESQLTAPTYNKTVSNFSFGLGSFGGKIESIFWNKV